MPRISNLLEDTQIIEEEKSLTGDQKLVRYYDLYEKRAHSFMDKSRADVTRAALRGKEKEPLATIGDMAVMRDREFDLAEGGK